MADFRKITPLPYRHSLGDRTYQSNNTSEFKTPLIPSRRKRKFIKNELELNHHNYKITRNRTIVKDYKTVVITNKQKSSHSTSSKSIHRRKVRKVYSSYTCYQSEPLLSTPAAKMMQSISKRYRETDKRPRETADKRLRESEKRLRETDNEVLNATKKRRMDAVKFNIEPDDERSFCLEVLFDVTKTRPTDKEIPDQNENLVSFSNCSRQHKCPELSNTDRSTVELSSIGLKTEMKPVTIKVDSFKNDYDVPESKPIKSSPVDEKFNFDCSMDDTTDLIESKDVKPSVVVKHESDISDSVCAYDDIPFIPHAGQLLWVRYGSYPYWPAIVDQYEAATDKLDVRYFAYNGQSNSVKKNNVFDFNGMNSFLQYKKTMKHSKSHPKQAFNTSGNKKWAKAVVEATFALSKDLDMRLAFFDIIVISSLCDDTETASEFATLVEIHSQPSQLETIRNICKENPNICVEIKSKLAEMAVVSPEIKRTTPAPTLAKKCNTASNTHRRHSAPTQLVQKRTSIRLASVKQCQLSVSQSAETLFKDEITTEKPQKKSADSSKSKEKKRIEFDTAFEIYQRKAQQKDMLFHCLEFGNVCKICVSSDDKIDGDVVKCSGSCGDYVHPKCGRRINSSNKVTCHECIDLSSKVCYACKKTSLESMQLCSIKSCGRYYHTECLGCWPQTKSEKLVCPSHVCHTCVCDDPKNNHVQTTDSKLTRCIKCPSTFHIDSTCIPAGVKILTKTQHICIRHRTETRTKMNLNWCYICGGIGGKLLLCDSCPHASHPECLPKTPDVDEDYYCDSCENCRHPLYGEIVWTKYGNTSWWPAVLVPPVCIPDSVENATHNEHDVCVRFFGSFDFGWVGRSFYYLYSDGDAKESNCPNVKLSEAIAQAESWHVKQMDTVKKKRDLLPLPFNEISKIKVVRPAKLIRKKNESHSCSCRPDDDDPCGPTSNCANRACYTECDAMLCPCGSKCNNQWIEKRVYVKFKRQHMGVKGFGLVAETFISEDTLIIEYVGELVTDGEYRSRLATKQTHNTYFMQYGRNLYIDAEHKGNMSRFMNHSCNPNCQPRTWIVKGVERIGLFALHDITEGTELTFNYEFDDDTHKCFCGEPLCRGIIGGKLGGKGKRKLG